MIVRILVAYFTIIYEEGHYNKGHSQKVEHVHINGFKSP